MGMSEMGDTFRALTEHIKVRRGVNLLNADSDGWKKHTAFHWSRELNGERLDYWPSRNKFMYLKKVMCGDVKAFIAKRELSKFPLVMLTEASHYIGKPVSVWDADGRDSPPPIVAIMIGEDDCGNVWAVVYDVSGFILDEPQCFQFWEPVEVIYE